VGRKRLKTQEPNTHTIFSTECGEKKVKQQEREGRGKKGGGAVGESGIEKQSRKENKSACAEETKKSGEGHGRYMESARRAMKDVLALYTEMELSGHQT